MPDLTPKLAGPQQYVLDTLYAVFKTTRDWPSHQYVETELETHFDVDLNEVLAGLLGLYWPNNAGGGVVRHTPAEKLGLRLRGLAAATDGGRDAELFVHVVRRLIERRKQLIRPSTPQDAIEPSIRAAEVVGFLEELHGPPFAYQVELVLELLRAEPFLPSPSGPPDDRLLWTILLTRDIRRFKDAQSIDDMLAQIPDTSRLAGAMPDLRDASLWNGPLLSSDTEVVAPPQSVDGWSAPPPQADTPEVALLSEGQAEIGGSTADAAVARPRPTVGMVFNGYELVEKIKEGGNGEIWRAQGESDERAYKFVGARSVDSEKYRRFRREVETMTRLRDSALAILPIFDAHLPDDPRVELAWFSMPIAETLDVALRGKSLALKVRVLRDIALTLADLATEEGINHRDVKPPNLYFHEGRYVIGDFGLVTATLDPEIEPITRPGHVPGPRNYMPPEAFLRPGEAAERPIDVYCFAKTLWVIATEEIGPPGGQIRADDRWALRHVLPAELRAAELDSAIEKATSNDADERPTIGELAEELARWAHGRSPAQVVQAAAVGIHDLAPDSAIGVARRITELLDAGSEVGRREFLKAERRRFEAALRTLLEERQESMGGDDLDTFLAAIEPVLERYLAVHLPLVEHRSPLLDEQIVELGRIGNTSYVSASSYWNSFASWAAWWMGHALGVVAVLVENVGAIRLLFLVTIEQNLGLKSLPAMLTPEEWRA